jgi:hypothetical protein
VNGVVTGSSVAVVAGAKVTLRSLFQFDPEPMQEIRDYLDRVSEQWDQALARLKSFVEE